MDSGDDGSQGKRPYAGEEDGQAKRARFNEGQNLELRILIPSKQGGAIIGKSGSTIKRLRTEYNSTILVPDADGPERVLSISSSLTTALDILSEILNCIEPGKSGEMMVRMLIHQSQAGAVIGKSGFKIKQIREETGANVKVYSECAPNSSERIVEISGSNDIIIRTIETILNFLQEIPPKGFTSMYDPNNFDESYAHDYGGFTSFENSSNRQRGPSRGAQRGGNFTSPFRGRGSSGGFGGGSRMTAPMFGISRGGRREYDSFRNDYDSGGMNEFGRGGGAVETTQVSIPKELAGAIIGKGGMRIKQIRMESQATITIEEPQPGSNDRIINISGTPDQIQNAQYLLQMSVKQHSGMY